MILNEQKTLYLAVLCTCGVLFSGVAGAAENSADPQGVSLTEFVQQGENVETPAEDKADTPEEERKTWAGNIYDKAVKKGAEIIASSNKNTNTGRRSNASVFDIAGVMLRMSQQQALQALVKRGYQKTHEKLEIPNFIQWRYEEMCRKKGVVGFERLNSCVVLMAKKNDYQFVQHQTFSSFKTGETVEVFYTSNFTGNKVYRVMYSSDAANIKGSGAKADYLRNLKIYDFWKKINQKYGRPDNQEQIIWGLGDNKPSLQAATGRLILWDPMLRELDFARMAREDQKFMNTAVYTF